MLSVLLSIYPEMGYHPATYAGQEIPNDTTGRIYQYEGTDLFLDLYDTVRDLDTREKFNDVFYSQEKTKSFFAKRLLKPNPFYQHLGLNFIPNILDPDFFAKNPQTPLTFTVWGVDLTAEDINKMIAADVLPLGMSTEITPKFDGFKATPHGFWAHDFLHYVYNLKFSFREQIKVIYNSVTYSPYKQHHFSVPRSFSYFDFPKQSISMTEVLHVMFFLWQHEIAEYNDHESPEKSFDLSFGDIHREIGDEDSTLPRNLVTFFEILKEKGLMKEKSCGDEGAYCDAALSSPGAKWELYGLLNMWLHQFKRYVFP